MYGLVMIVNCASIRNLVGKRWLSDYEIDKVFHIVNEVYNNTIGFVCKPTHILYLSSGLHEKFIVS